MARKQRQREIPFMDRMHHIIEYGDIIFSNGYGVKNNCHECDGGYLDNGDVCAICQPKREAQA